MASEPRPSLVRSHDRMIAGVCHGLGDYFDVDAVIVRLTFVLLTVAGGLGILAYVILWVIMPPAGAAVVSGPGAVGEGIRTMAAELRDVGRDVRQSLRDGDADPEASPPEGGSPAAGGRQSRHRGRGDVFFGMVLVILGVWLLLGNLGLLDWTSARYVWPVVLIALGLTLLVKRLR